MRTEYGTGFGPQSSSLSPLRSPGAVAQLGEHLLCKQRVVGSIPISSTKLRPAPLRHHSGDWSYRSNEHRNVLGQAVSTIERLRSALVFATEWFH
jgi:hypothetical protein